MELDNFPNNEKLQPQAVRERRPVLGLEGILEVSQDGLVYDVHHGKYVSPKKWPYVVLEHNGGSLDLNAIECVAMSWLTAEERSTVRIHFEVPFEHSKKTRYPAVIRKLATQFGVYDHAIACVAATTSDDGLSHLQRVKSQEVVSYGRVFNGRLQNYFVKRLGSTWAHVLTMDKNHYSFLDGSPKPRARAGDTATYLFATTVAGHNNIDVSSLSVLQKKTRQ